MLVYGFPATVGGVVMFTVLKDMMGTRCAVTTTSLRVLFCCAISGVAHAGRAGSVHRKSVRSMFWVGSRDAVPVNVCRPTPGCDTIWR